MATSVISNTTRDPAGNPVGNVPVTITLFRAGQPAAGFRISDQTQVASAVSFTSNSGGAWAAGLEQNANIFPSGSYYVVQEFIPAASGYEKDWAILVGTGPQTVQQALIITPPAVPVPTTASLILTGNNTFTGTNTFNGGAYFGSGSPWADAKAHGALGDGVTDDTAAIQAAVNALPVGGGVAFIPPSANYYMISAPITLPNGVILRGSGEEVSRIKALASFSGSAMVTNLHADGTQQDCYVEYLTIDGNKSVATAGDGILFDSIFVDSAIRKVKVRNMSGVGVHLVALSSVGCGAVYVDSLEVDHCNADNILSEGAVGDVTWLNVDSERPGSTSACVHLKGGTPPAPQGSHLFLNLYSEIDGSSQGTLLIEKAHTVTATNVVVAGTTAAGQYLIRMIGSSTGLTSDNLTANISVTGMYSPKFAGTGGFTMIDDQVRGSCSLSNADGFCPPYMTNDLYVFGQVTAGEIRTRTAANATLFNVDQNGNITSISGVNTGYYGSAGNPNGSIGAGVGSLCVDGGTPGLWFKSTGGVTSSGWTQVTIP